MWTLLVELCGCKFKSRFISCKEGRTFVRELDGQPLEDVGIGGAELGGIVNEADKEGGGPAVDEGSDEADEADAEEE